MVNIPIYTYIYIYIIYNIYIYTHFLQFMQNTYTYISIIKHRVVSVLYTRIAVIKNIGVRISAHFKTFVLHISCSFFLTFLHDVLEAMRHIVHRTLPGQGDEAGADLGTIRNGADSNTANTGHSRKNAKNCEEHDEYMIRI